MFFLSFATFDMCVFTSQLHCVEMFMSWKKTKNLKQQPLATLSNTNQIEIKNYLIEQISFVNNKD